MVADDTTDVRSGQSNGRQEVVPFARNSSRTQPQQALGTLAAGTATHRHSGRPAAPPSCEARPARAAEPHPA
jgi:hypothetical protein